MASLSAVNSHGCLDDVMNAPDQPLAAPPGFAVNLHFLALRATVQAREAFPSNSPSPQKIAVLELRMPATNPMVRGL